MAYHEIVVSVILTGCFETVTAILCPSTPPHACCCAEGGFTIPAGVEKVSKVSPETVGLESPNQILLSTEQ